MSSRAIPTVYIKYEYEGRMYKEGCAKLNRSPFGCSRSSTGSIPGILPNIVHTVLYCSVKNPGRRTDLPSTWVQKEFFLNNV